MGMSYGFAKELCQISASSKAVSTAGAEPASEE